MCGFMNLVLGTTQKLMMSQNMLQSTIILQMSASELIEYVNSLTEENPVLDVKNNFDSENTPDSIKRKIEYIDSLDEQNRTSNPKIFAGGDLAGAKGTVAWAARSGRNAANAIIEYLK